MSSDDTSDTDSLLTLTDSVCKQLYRYREDRRYQCANQDYIWPCDMTAAKLELRIASVFEQTYANGLHWEPGLEEAGGMKEVLSASSVDGPPRAVDLGCGITANWAISMAERYPAVECIGVDLVPPGLTYLPANLSIEIVDLLEGLPYPDEYFNLVHSRFGAGTSSFFHNPRLDFLAEIARVLKPGGVLLLEQVDNILTPFRCHDPNNPYLPVLQNRYALRFANHGPSSIAHMDFGDRMGKLVRKTEGFGRVLEKSVDLPLGTSKDLGPPERQRGAIHRAAWIDVLECQGAAVGLVESMLQTLRRADEEAFPVEDVGLFVRVNILWAVKEAGPVRA